MAIYLIGYALRPRYRRKRLAHGRPRLLISRRFHASAFTFEARSRRCKTDAVSCMQDAERIAAAAGIVFAADFAMKASRCGSALAVRRVIFPPVV
jgi:hypothetical protein